MATDREPERTRVIRPPFRALVYFGLCVQFFASMFRHDYYDAAFAIGLAWFIRNWPV